MKDSAATLDEAVRAFQDSTAAAADGAVTRARVLAHASGHLRRRRMLRRTAGLLPGLVVFLSLGTAAWTAAFHWRAPATVAIGDPSGSPNLPREIAGAPHRTIPAISEPTVEIDPWLAESRTYARAHQVHFVDDDPAGALARWNAYLRRYPRGTFAPEARFNRSLCLIRLGRVEEAAPALRAVARDRASAYHQPDACALLRWLGQRSARRQAEWSEAGCD